MITPPSRRFSHIHFWKKKDTEKRKTETQICPHMIIPFFLSPRTKRGKERFANRKCHAIVHISSPVIIRGKCRRKGKSKALPLLPLANIGGTAERTPVVRRDRFGIKRGNGWKIYGIWALCLSVL
jgi:hypothetical protein